MVGREIEEAGARGPYIPGDVVLEVRDLSLPWPGHARQWRLRHIGFSLHRGEILGLAGLMGAGRTELLECLFGSSWETPCGEILLEGRPAVFRDPVQAMRAGLALVSEDRKRLGIFANLDVGRNISICNLREVTRFGWIDFRQERAMAEGAARQLGVKTADLSAPVTSLSGGNQQKAILGRWLLTRPTVLLLDDPTRGIDVGAKAELYRIMDELCRSGMGILFTTSELPELVAVCDRILVLAEGHAVGEVCRTEATEQRIMELATQRPSHE